MPVMLHTFMAPDLLATNTSALQLPPMESTKFTSVKLKPMPIHLHTTDMLDTDMDTHTTVTVMADTDMVDTMADMQVTVMAVSDTDMVVN